MVFEGHRKNVFRSVIAKLTIFIAEMDSAPLSESDISHLTVGPLVSIVFHYDRWRSFFYLHVVFEGHRSLEL